jgi:hypothetical protein
MTKQITTFGSNFSKLALFVGNSKSIYNCSNSTITRGICGAPGTLDECFNNFPSVKKIAESIGFIKGSCAGSCGAPSYVYDLFTGSAVPSQTVDQTPNPIDIYFDDASGECAKINAGLGPDWLGCLWGTPSSSFSCTCPKIGPFFHAYLKLRLNVATFWNTPKNTPVKRAEFLDSLKYSTKVNITVPGDFKLKIGQLVKIKVDNSSGFPYNSRPSILSGAYYIIGVKHVVNNSGTHETALALTALVP